MMAIGAQVRLLAIASTSTQRRIEICGRTNNDGTRSKNRESTRLVRLLSKATPLSLAPAAITIGA